MIWLVPTAQVDQVWPDVEALLRPVTDLPACRYTLAGVHRALGCGDKQLFVAIEQGTIVAAATTKIMSYDAGDWLCIVLCGGRGFEEWGEEGIEAIEEWARRCDCRGVEIFGRAGWAPALGYERTASLVQKELR